MYEEHAKRANPQFKFKLAATPFVEDACREGPRASPSDGKWLECSWCKGRFAPASFTLGTGSGASRVATRCSGSVAAADPIEPDSVIRGELAESAASILMKLLYLSLIHI